MGAEQEASGEAHQTGQNGEVPAVPQPEEPPKMEDIVTPDVLQAVIDGYKPTAKLISFQAQPGSKIGDNYMSIMYAVDLDLESNTGKETLRIMLKTIPRNVFRMEMINEMMAFKKEATIYKQVFPLFIETQEEKGIPKEQIFAAWPACYAAHLDGSTDFLAMENMKVIGFKMGNRVKGLDFNHCALVLRNLAQYHSISYARFGGSRDNILEKYPIFAQGMFTKDTKTSEMQQQFFSQSFAQQAEQLKGAGEDLAGSRLEKIAKLDLMTVLGDLVSKDIEHAVISHGDCWVNNMLFKYDDNDEKCSHPSSVKFIDFQLSSATSRLVDVYYFLMTSCQVEVLKEMEKDLLMIYYSEFTSSAQKLSVNTKERGLSWENFLKEADKYRLYGILMGLLLAPMLSADAADVPDMDSFTKEDIDNSEETIQKFFKDLMKDTALKKIKVLATDHLSNCSELLNMIK